MFYLLEEDDRLRASFAERRLALVEIAGGPEGMPALGKLSEFTALAPGANTIGMLVRSSGEQSLLAIGIGGPTDRMDAKRQQIIDALRRRLGMTV